MSLRPDYLASMQYSVILRSGRCLSVKSFRARVSIISCQKWNVFLVQEVSH